MIISTEVGRNFQSNPVDTWLLASSCIILLYSNGNICKTGATLRYFTRGIDCLRICCDVIVCRLCLGLSNPCFARFSLSLFGILSCLTLDCCLNSFCSSCLLIGSGFGCQIGCSGSMMNLYLLTQVSLFPLNYHGKFCPSARNLLALPFDWKFRTAHPTRFFPLHCKQESFSETQQPSKRDCLSFFSEWNW